MKKPFDIGNTIISSSIAHNGKLITVNCGSEKHGFIKLAPIESFNNDDWYEPEKVREYRNSFLIEETAEKGIGLTFDFEEYSEEKTELPVQFKNNTNILYRKVSSDRLELNNYLFIPSDKNYIICVYDIENYSKNTVDSTFSLSGLFGIIRASYGQITENGPIPLPEILNKFEYIDNNSFKIIERGTGSCCTVKIVGEYDSFHINQKELESEIPFPVKTSGSIKVTPGNKKNIALIITLDDRINTDVPSLDLEEVFLLMKKTEENWKKFAVNTGNKEMDYIVFRNFAYSFSCCFLKKFGAFITDHQSLPLTWNRDNYFMFKLIEQVYIKTKSPELLSVMKEHLNWLFTYISDEGWGRSHLINGRVKDKVFQFDQQCYPILEIYDFLQTADLEPELLKKCINKLDMLSNLLLDKKAENIMLFETDENPADDPVLYPYHFSTQVLAWKTFNILSRLNSKYNFSDKDYNSIADEIHNAIFKYMITEKNSKKLFCYTTDAKGNFELYHDANDLPTTLAPMWGFLNCDDEVFQNTIDWGFSPENRGFYPGRFGGLGSDHAKGHWPLGTAQLLAVSLAGAENKLWNETIKKLKNIVMEDGLFSESVFPDTGKVFTRYWFAWPGATVSWLYLELMNSD